jgi:CheY-like chemotaxis protein
MARVQRNVLIVEDYQPNVMVTTATLERLGYNYDMAENGIAALKKFMVGKYDVILMDIQMHDLDGLQATKRIRQMEKERELPPTPIIAMTAHVREQDKNQCIEFGMNDFIPKPFDPQELERKLALYIKL